MEELNKKAGYLSGLLAGMNADKDPVTAAIADLLNALTERVSAHEILLTDLNDYVESIDDDLSALENGSSPEGSAYDDDDSTAEHEPLHIVKSGAKPAPRDTVPAGCVCPECRAMFLIASSDAAGLRYECPVCHSVVLPEPLSPENAVLVDPVEE